MPHDKLALPRAIIDEFHNYFNQSGIDNYEHIMNIKQIIIAACKFYPDESKQIKNELFEYAFNLFWDEWKESLETDEEEYDLHEEHETARRIFEQTDEREESIWPDD